MDCFWLWIVFEKDSLIRCSKGMWVESRDSQSWEGMLNEGRGRKDRGTEIDLDQDGGGGGGVERTNEVRWRGNKKGQERLDGGAHAERSDPMGERPQAGNERPGQQWLSAKFQTYELETQMPLFSTGSKQRNKAGISSRRQGSRSRVERTRY